MPSFLCEKKQHVHSFFFTNNHIMIVCIVVFSKKNQIMVPYILRSLSKNDRMSMTINHGDMDWDRAHMPHLSHPLDLY
jgi:hypothetical protein